MTPYERRSRERRRGHFRPSRPQPPIHHDEIWRRLVENVFQTGEPCSVLAPEPGRTPRCRHLKGCRRGRACLFTGARRGRPSRGSLRRGGLGMRTRLTTPLARRRLPPAPDRIEGRSAKRARIACRAQWMWRLHVKLGERSSAAAAPACVPSRQIESHFLRRLATKAIDGVAGNVRCIANQQRVHRAQSFSIGLTTCLRQLRGFSSARPIFLFPVAGNEQGQGRCCSI